MTTSTESEGEQGWLGDATSITKFMEQNPVAVERAFQGALHQAVRGATVLTAYVDDSGALVQVKHDLTYAERQQIAQRKADRQRERKAKGEAERARLAAERAKRMPTIYNNSVGFGREILSSLIFAAIHGNARAKLENMTATSFRGTPLSYRGPQLSQADARVLEFLIHAARRDVTAAVKFSPMAFVKHIGWHPCSRNVDQLRACIERLQEAVLKIGTPGVFCVSVQCVGAFVDAGERWSVSLHETVAGLFTGGCTYIDIDRRRALSDGLQSWLAGFLCANDDEDTFEMSDLHLNSGVRSGLKQFSREVRETAMPKLQAVGVVVGYDSPHGKLRVQRPKKTTAEAA